MQYLFREYTSEGYVDKNGKTIWSLLNRFGNIDKIISRISLLKEQFPYHRCELYVRENEFDNWEKVFNKLAKDINDFEYQQLVNIKNHLL